jgi:hydrogenase 3 maturation protease
MNFEEQLATGLEGVVVVMGIGNPVRGDDAAGSLAARRIVGLPGVHVIDTQDVPEDYLLRVVSQRPDTIVLIDSVDLNSAPGSVAFLERDQMAEYWPSTHRMPVSLLMGILAQETHARVIGIGIQPAHTEFLRPPSEAVAASVAHVADMLNGALARGRTAAHAVFAGSLEGEVPA